MTQSLTEFVECSYVTAIPWSFPSAVLSRFPKIKEKNAKQIKISINKSSLFDYNVLVIPFCCVLKVNKYDKFILCKKISKM